AGCFGDELADQRGQLGHGPVGWVGLFRCLDRHSIGNNQKKWYGAWKKWYGTYQSLYRTLSKEQCCAREKSCPPIPKKAGNGPAGPGGGRRAHEGVRPAAVRLGAAARDRGRLGARAHRDRVGRRPTRMDVGLSARRHVERDQLRSPPG